MATETTSTTEAGRALKARHRAMWAFGDYPAVATDLVSELGPVLAGACEIRPGDRVLARVSGSQASISSAKSSMSAWASSSSRLPRDARTSANSAYLPPSFR